MFWKFFVSEQKVREALEHAGDVYDICPNTIRMPANSDQQPKADQNPSGLTLWTDYQYSEEETDIKVEEYWASVANTRNR